MLACPPLSSRQMTRLEPWAPYPKAIFQSLQSTHRVLSPINTPLLTRSKLYHPYLAGAVSLAYCSLTHKELLTPGSPISPITSHSPIFIFKDNLVFGCGQIPGSINGQKACFRKDSGLWQGRQRQSSQQQKLSWNHSCLRTAGNSRRWWLPLLPLQTAH